MSSGIVDQLDSIFDVPKNGSNIRDESEESQEGAYAEVAPSHDNATFEQKAKELSDKIAQAVPTADVQYTAQPEVTANVQQTVAQQPEQPAPAVVSNNSFEEILSKSIPTKQPVVPAVQPLVSEQIFENKDTTDVQANKDNDKIRIEPASVPNVVGLTAAPSQPNPVKHVQVEDSEQETAAGPIYEQKPNADGWMLTPPAPMYSRFYDEKGAFIRNITSNGRPLDIDKLVAELKNSSVSTNVELTDLVGMGEKLTKIQDYLDRVVQIKIQATSQCSACKRGVELLRGVLAKVSYEKPAARQDGVIYDHMRDVEMYAARIESLEQSAKDVYHNLLEAKEILSRKISIAIELVKQQHVTDGLEKSFGSLPENVKRAAQTSSSHSKLADEGFDRLEVQEAVKNFTPKPDRTMKKAGQSDWMD